MSVHLYKKQCGGLLGKYIFQVALIGKFKFYVNDTQKKKIKLDKNFSCLT